MCLWRQLRSETAIFRAIAIPAQRQGLTTQPNNQSTAQTDSQKMQMLRRLAGGAATVRSSSAAAAFRRLLHTGSGGGCGSGEPESVAYRMSMLRRPSSVGKRGLPWNSCSLIGRLAAPVTPYEDSCEEYPEAYTFLSVSPSSPASSSSSSKFTLSPSLLKHFQLGLLQKFVLST